MIRTEWRAIRLPFFNHNVSQLINQKNEIDH
jgi:hypothetical protein